MSNRRKQARLADKVAKLRSTDLAVLSHLHGLRNAEGGSTCKASIPDIARACGISQRQVQISASRLIEAGLLERSGYDFGNIKRRERGTIYRVLIPLAGLDRNLLTERLERAVQLLAERQAALEVRVIQLTFAWCKLPSQIVGVENKDAVLSRIKRGIITLSPEQQRRLSKWLARLLQDGQKCTVNYPRKISRQPSKKRDTTSGNHGLV
ncbi:MAG TPA: helix-turn-helix domain-containing protein [Pyrinomonadaceae bacterium]|jgi:hypothetical protein